MNNKVTNSNKLNYSIKKVIGSILIEFLFFPFSIFSILKKRTTFEKILIIEPFDIGDAVMITALFEPLKKRFPDSEIHVLVKPICAKLFKDDIRVHSVHSFNLPWAERKNKLHFFSKTTVQLISFIFQLRKFGFTIGIDTRGDVRSHIMMTLIGCCKRVGSTKYVNSNLSNSGLLLTNKATFNTNLHKAEFNLQTIKDALSCDITGCRPELRITNLSKQPNAVFTIVCHPGAGSKCRLWTNKNWALVADTIQKEYAINFKFIGSTGEKELIREILNYSHGKIETEITTFESMIQNILSCDIFICLDSGPMHIAAALDKQVIALFGPGDLKLWYPYTDKSIVLTHADQYECAPCVQNFCVYPESSCMQTIQPYEVITAIKKVLPPGLRKLN